MSIKRLVNEHIKIEAAERRLQARKRNLEKELQGHKYDVVVLDNVVWKVERDGWNRCQLSRVGTLEDE